MAKEINLLPEKKDYEKISHAQIRKAKIMSLAIAGFSVLATIPLLAYSGALLWQNQLMLTQKNTLTSEIRNYRDREGLFKLLADKAWGIEYIFNERKDFAGALANIETASNPSINISKLSMDEAGNISLTAMAADSAGMQAFVNNLTNPSSGQKKFSKVVITKISDVNALTYKMDLTMSPKW